jgi:pimeloyl-ACP methyl ester carboxylesterase
LEALALHFHVDVLGYDYSGYGESRVPVIGEETIVRDLEIVVAWVNRPLSKIILWGFSLGTFPTVCNAAMYSQLAGMVLQCPIASVNCIF